MNETTTVSVRGIRTTLSIGATYDVRWTRGGRLRHLRGVTLSSRTPNGSLRFDRGERADPVLRFTTVKPGELEAVDQVAAPKPVPDLAAALAERSPDLAPHEEAIRDAGPIDGVEPPPVSSDEEARARAERYAKRNHLWKCSTCHRRTRQPVCTNGHPAVAAPAGKRKDDR